jgi:amidohydrolase
VTIDLHGAVAEAMPGVVALRRRLHRHPELGLDLPRTQQAVLGALDPLGLDVTTGKALRSVVAVLKGSRPGRTVLLRADMDALPIRERTGLEFASEVDGAMHACGHDAHTAMLVGAAEVLAANRSELAGRVIFAFQPGEEGHGGAELMLAEGLLDGPDPPAAAFALHVAPGVPAGVVVTRPGTAMASADDFTVEISGRPGHGAMPHEALDPIPVACQAVLGMHTLVPRSVEPAVLTIGSFQAGGSATAIPETVHLAGTLRALSNVDRVTLIERLRGLVEGIAQGHGARARFEVDEHRCGVTVNDERVTAVVAAAARDVADECRSLPAPVMASEDFAAVLERVPGSMAFLGVRPDGVDAPAPVHSPEMVLEEDALAVGVALHASVARRLAAGEGA